MRLSLVFLGMLLAATATAAVQVPKRQAGAQAPPRATSAPPAAAKATPATAPASTSTPPAKSGREKDERDIAANDEAFVKAFNAGDAKAIAATFTEDAELIDEDGNAFEGREAIAAMFATGFEAHPGTKIALKNDPIKFLGPETALVRGRAEVTPADGSSPDVSRYTVIFVKRGGAWLQASSRDEYDQPVSHHEKLKELEWLIGDWISESEESVVATSCEWAENKNFLVRRFTLHLQGRPAMTGTQRIGWDPVTRQFKSWVFDSEGGYGEGFWTHDGQRWVIKASGVRHDGKHASATQVITRMGKDMIRWRSVDRTVGGKIHADVDEVVLVRKPPKPR
jgi:uncharacterized protein (TIGR02246 family)